MALVGRAGEHEPSVHPVTTQLRRHGHEIVDALLAKEPAGHEHDRGSRWLGNGMEDRQVDPRPHHQLDGAVAADSPPVEPPPVL
jgi:hypothetical protein